MTYAEDLATLARDAPVVLDETLVPEPAGELAARVVVPVATTRARRRRIALCAIP